MAEVVDWNPVDDNNNTAPPVGWPEGMAPSAVNNAARAMQGALRREHDRLTAGTLDLPYVKRSGDTITGNLAVNGTGGVSLGATQLRNISAGLEAYNASGGAVFSRGPIAGYYFGDRNQSSPQWNWYANAGTANFGRIDTGVALTVSSTGNLAVAGPVSAPSMTATGTITANTLHATGNVVADVDLGGRDLNLSRNVNAPGYVSAGGDLYGVNLHLSSTYIYFSGATGSVNTTGGPLIYADNSNHVYKQGSGNGAFVFQNYAGASVAQINSAGGLSLSTVTATGNITAAGNITAPAFVGQVSVPSNGPVSTGGTVTGGQVTSTGNITASSGTVSAANVSTSSNVTAAGSVTGGFIHSTGTCQIDGQCNFLQTVNIGPGGAYARIDGVGTYNITGSWLTFSGRAVKEAIEPYERGLEAIMALKPVAYRYRPELYGAEEAETTRYGLVADEVAPVVPEMVGEAVFGGRNLSTLNTGHLVFCLINAAKTLVARNSALEARLALLEAEYAAGR